MKRALLLGVVFAGLLAPGSAAAAGSVYFTGVFGGKLVCPRSLNLTVDGTLEVSNVHWNSWGGSVAVGHGRAEYHGCTPNCAASPVHHASVTVRLSRIRRCGSRRYYSHVALIRRSGRKLDAGFLRLSFKPCH